jgi:hypothetical protein
LEEEKEIVENVRPKSGEDTRKKMRDKLNSEALKVKGMIKEKFEIFLDLLFCKTC